MAEFRTPMDILFFAALICSPQVSLNFCRACKAPFIFVSARRIRKVEFCQRPRISVFLKFALVYVPPF